MKILLVIIFLSLLGCSSRIRLSEHKDYAYIFTESLERTSLCNGVSLKIVGIRQENRVAVNMSMHSIHVPKGKNYIYYTFIHEWEVAGDCEIIEEVVIQHSEVPVPRLERKPPGQELMVEVEGGKTYVLVPHGEEVVLQLYE